MSEEWSEWFLHDGKGCPCVGCWAQLVFRDIEWAHSPTTTIEALVHGDTGPMSGWLWKNSRRVKVIIRYRIRKPRALLELIEMVENLPANPKVPV